MPPNTITPCQLLVLLHDELSLLLVVLVLLPHALCMQLWLRQKPSCSTEKG